MTKYLIDVNLPRHIPLWDNQEFIHQIDINDEWSDHEIWKYAKENSLTIVSKDSDFSNRMMAASPPPRVIHFELVICGLGNSFHSSRCAGIKFRNCQINTSLLQFTLKE